MKVYVAGSYQFRKQIAELIGRIKVGIPRMEVVSRWLYQGEEKDELLKKGHQHFIDIDFADIDNCDLLLLINEPPMSKHSTGKWVELGVALNSNKLVVVWGAHEESLFIHDESVIHITGGDVRSLTESLAALEVSYRVRKKVK